MPPSSEQSSNGSLHSDGQNSVLNTPTTPLTPTTPTGFTPTLTTEDAPSTRITQVVLLSDMHPSHRTWNVNSNITAQESCATIPSPDHPAKSVLIVEEINEEWTELFTAYLPPTDPDFIQQHFNRLDHNSGGGNATSGSESVHIADMSQHHAPAAKVAGFHLDGIRTVQSLRCQENRPIQPWCSAETGMCFLKSATARPVPEHFHRQQSHSRREVFIRNSDKKWEKATTRVSGIELHDGLCK
jgi:hypothetical protein